MFSSREDWLKWRKGGIGSSDAAILQGESDYGTPLTVYEDKITEKVEEETGYILDKGNKVEIRIRSLFNAVFGKNFAPSVHELEGYPFIRASLDGSEGDEFMECKLLSSIDSRKIVNEGAPGFIHWKNAKEKGIVRKDHWIQIQHQFLATGKKKCHYLALKEDKAKKFPDWSDIAHVEVLPDPDFMLKLFADHSEFWVNHVQKRKPPVLSEDDAAALKGVTPKINKWKKVKEKIETLEVELDALRGDIIEAAIAQGHGKYETSGVRVRKESRQGSIEYKKIPAIKEMKKEELDKFRGAGSVSWKVEPIKEEKKNED